MAVVENEYKTVDELEIQLGSHVKTLRLRQELTQAQLAERADVALGAVKNVESGRGARINTLVRLLKILGRASWIDTLAPEVSIRPMQMLRSSRPRQRAYAPRPTRRPRVQEG